MLSVFGEPKKNQLELSFGIRDRFVMGHPSSSSVRVMTRHFRITQDLIDQVEKKQRVWTKPIEAATIWKDAKSMYADMKRIERCSIGHE